jgi:hypothetical protein
MAEYEHLGLAGDISQLRLFGNRRFSTASAFAYAARVSDAAYNRRHAVALQESDVAAPQQAVAAIGANRGLPSASARAQAGWVRAARVVGLNCFATVRHSAIVAFQVARLVCERLAASAFAGLRAWWPDQRGLSASRFDLVPVDESAPARKTAVGTICDLTASALAKLAKINLGHLISRKDLWSAGSGVHALGQPFYCIRCKVG